MCLYSEDVHRLEFNKLFIYQTYNIFESSQSKESIIINLYENDIKVKLIEFANKLKNDSSYTDDRKYDDSSVYHHNLKVLKSIVSDDRVIYYISKFKNFLFYYNKLIRLFYYNISLTCKFAVSIGEFRFAVFTYLSDECNLNLSFNRYGYIEEIKISRSFGIPLNYDKDNETLGSDNTTVNSRDHIASVLKDQRKYDEALEIYQEQFNIRKKILGPDNPSTLSTIERMVSVLKKQEKHDEALQIYQKHFNIQNKTLEPDDYTTLIT